MPAISPHAPTIDVLPREGMVANVRNRRAVITRVSPFDAPSLASAATPATRVHLVTVDYADLEYPSSETLLWEREVSASITPPRALPDVHDRPAMHPRLFDAIVRSARWQALTPFITPDGTATAPTLPIASPFHGAVQVEDYQLEPLLRALRMPRVSLLLADDVGLGKTVEAGLILSELLLRRRARRVLILTPGALRDQWQEEMQDKFALPFDPVDRDSTWQLRKRIGLDANPWRTFPRIVASYHYLRQADVLEQFLATCRDHADHARLPWDLLVVDEAHNLMPTPFGQDSDLVEMLRAISPYFEHKLFLTATPHNGHTESFSGLLELLDPVRFHRTDALSDGDRKRLESVLVRRLKRDIAAHDAARGTPPRFGRRVVESLSVALAPAELDLVRAFRRFKDAFRKSLASRPSRTRVAGGFALSALEKRLLSGPPTFADSWFRLLDGLAEPAAPSDAELDAANRATIDELADDAERAHRERSAARIIGAWLRPHATGAILPPAIDAITAALRALRLETTPHAPSVDARYATLRALVDERLRTPAGTFRPDERLIVFTEYKTTLDYLVARLRRDFPAHQDAIAELFGGMEQNTRHAVRIAFNDNASPVRILVATDAASEGLNLQETARYLLHFDIPWNPSRLEQRNGRLDRHGQARDVTVFHFTSDNDEDLAFLGRVVGKVDRIREDLGAVGEVFDNAFARRFEDAAAVAQVEADLDAELDLRRAAVALPTTAATSVDTRDVETLMRELDLSPPTLAETLAIALERDQGALSGPDETRCWRLATIPSRWEPVVDEHLRIDPSGRDASSGALPSLAFDPAVFIDTRSGRPVFRPRRGTALLHLAHPVYRHTLTALSRLRFDTSGDNTLSRWTVRRTELPPGYDAIISVTVEELAVNALREPFHHWLRTLRFPVSGRTLQPPLPHTPPPSLLARPPIAADVTIARRLYDDIVDDLRDALDAHALHIDGLLRANLATSLDAALIAAKTSFADRRKELASSITAIQASRIADKRRRELARELERLQRVAAQPVLPGLIPVAATPPRRIAELERLLETLTADAAAEAERRKAGYRRNLELLHREERRVLDHLLPRRFTLAMSANDRAIQLHPVAIEIQLPLATHGDH